jgi:dihydrodipicolinate synthase/N-acetylneuraminate lyase
MKLGGVIPANILPLRDGLSLDVEAYTAHVRGLAATPGVTALVCDGHAAEVASLSRTVRRQAIALAVEAVRPPLTRIDKDGPTGRNRGAEF